MPKSIIMAARAEIEKEVRTSRIVEGKTTALKNLKASKLHHAFQTPIKTSMTPGLEPVNPSFEMSPVKGRE